MIRIRKAETADAESLALIGEQTFRETFGAFNTKKDMDEYCTKNFGTRIQQNEIADKNKCTLLCESDNRIAGYVQTNLNAAFGAVADTSQAEIQRFYIVKDLHGKGAAQTLMNAALDTVRRLNIKHVWLGVWEKNPRAIAFYKKFGFEQIGEHVFLLGSDPQRDIILHKTF